MQDQNFFVDIHAHPTLRAYNTRPEEGQRNIWNKTYNPEFNTKLGRWARMQTRHILKESQCNLHTAASGGLRVIFDSLYPVEKGFLNFRKVPKTIAGKRGSLQMLCTSTGISPEQLRYLRQKKDYFQELLDQYAFLATGQGDSPCGTNHYRLVGDFGEISQMRTTDPNAMAVVLTIEGAHAFGIGTGDSLRMSKKTLREHLSANIKTVKSWKTPPLFVNLAHHFNNNLAGHARSLKAPVNSMYNQKANMGKGIFDAGWHVLEEMMSMDNGRRMFVDIKHMSLRSRMEYYRFVDRYNRIHPTDRIPVICSHTGVSGLETMEESLKTGSRNKKNGEFFNNWSINLSDEEIRFIHGTGGMIGLIMDKQMLASRRQLDVIDSLKTHQERHEAFIEVLVRNIFRMVEAIGDRSGWNTVVMGSDYDGLITHLDPYPDSESFPNIQADLIRYIEENNFRPDLWFGAEPRELIRKVMADNAMNFLAEHFWATGQQQKPLAG